ncbi:hypothetical protein L1G62_001948 [Staphylococcus pseudintermedius]|nr:hypothetical protein [Staphylococcus pseudintermedius]HEC2148456.1 hypothetical protein [Staphylococcus delphini]EIT1243484.1 hypothetical protein [Staphylococcus pseudintermedius]EIW3383816.1 hypothetical protein [Staphylococcus pseudintermedius]HEC2203806.1 hypothetical protein [Staphylococcus delphini]
MKTISLTLITIVAVYFFAAVVLTIVINSKQARIHNARVALLALLVLAPLVLIYKFLP